MAFCRDSQRSVLVGLASADRPGAVRHGHIPIRQRVLFVVGDSHSDVVVIVHFRAVREGDRDIAVLVNGHIRTRHRLSRFLLLHLDGDSGVVPVLILGANGSFAISIGIAGSAGNGELSALSVLPPLKLSFIVRHRDGHTIHRGLVLDKLDGNGSLVRIIQQAAIREPDRQGIVLVQNHGGICHRDFLCLYQ